MVKKYLSAPQVRRLHSQIESALRERAKSWGMHGWGYVGRAPRIRVAIRVPYKLHNPATPAASIPLSMGRSGRFQLKVAVEASYARAPLRTTAAEAGPASPVDQPLAPGAPIVVAAGHPQRAGIALVVSIGGDPYLVTCGHAFDNQSQGTVRALSGKPIAQLTQNFMLDGDPLDAALCALNDAGRQLLADSSDAPSWCNAVATPDPNDNAQPATVWPTNDGNGGPFVDDVGSFSACEPALFGHPECGFIRMPQCTWPGDSGCILTRNRRYYGLCSGVLGNASFFTPISSVMQRIRDTQGEVSLWSDG